MPFRPMSSTITPKGRSSTSNVIRSLWPNRWTFSSAETRPPGFTVILRPSPRAEPSAFDFRGSADAPSPAVSTSGSSQTTVRGRATTLSAPNPITSRRTSRPSGDAAAVILILATSSGDGGVQSIAAKRVPFASRWPASMTSGVDAVKPSGRPARSTLTDPS